MSEKDTLSQNDVLAEIREKVGRFRTRNRETVWAMHPEIALLDRAASEIERLTSENEKLASDLERTEDALPIDLSEILDD